MDAPIWEMAFIKPNWFKVAGWRPDSSGRQPALPPKKHGNIPL
jgi:hypothetical protein